MQLPSALKVSERTTASLLRQIERAEQATTPQDLRPPWGAAAARIADSSKRPNCALAPVVHNPIRVAYARSFIRLNAAEELGSAARALRPGT